MGKHGDCVQGDFTEKWNVRNKANSRPGTDATDLECAVVCPPHPVNSTFGFLVA